MPKATGSYTVSPLMQELAKRHYALQTRFGRLMHLGAEDRMKTVERERRAVAKVILAQPPSSPEEALVQLVAFFCNTIDRDREIIPFFLALKAIAATLDVRLVDYLADGFLLTNLPPDGGPEAVVAWAQERTAHAATA